MKSRYYISLVVTIMSMLLVSVCHAEVVELQKLKVSYHNKENGLSTGRSKIEIAKVHEPKSSLYKIRKKASGSYYKFDNVVWTMEADVRIEGGDLFVVYSMTKVFDENNKLIISYSKNYDYERGRVTFIRKDERRQKSYKRRYSIKGPTCDDVTLAVFLHHYIYVVNEAIDSFYLLSNEPGMYDVNLYNLGVESLNVADQQWQADRYRLIADVGPITKFMVKIVPPTYVWFSKDEPNQWLKYEGLEVGKKSRNIEARLEEYSVDK